MNKLIRHMLTYGVGGVLTKAINIIMVPIYTRILLPADYGSLDLIYIVGNLIAILYGFMISSGYIRIYYSCSSEEEKQRLFGSAFWFTLTNAVIFMFLTYLLSKEIASKAFTFPNGDQYLILVSISSAIFSLSIIFYNLLMVKEKAKSFVMINVISLLITMIITIILVVYLRRGIYGILVAQIIGRGIELAILSLILFQRTFFKISLSQIFEMLKYSIPLIPVQLAAFTLNLSNRFFLQAFTTLTSVGLYALGYKFASILLLFAIEPLRAFTPFIFSQIDNPERSKKTLADFTRYYIFVIFIITLGISMLSKEVIAIVADESYSSSWVVVYILTLSYAIYGTVVLSSYAIEIVKKNWISSAAWILGAIINVGLNILLIPRFGIIGAATATALSYTLVLIGYWIIISVVYPVPYQYLFFVGILTWGTFVYYLSTLVNSGIILSIAAKLGLIVVFIGGVILSGYLTEEELTKIRGLYPALRRALIKPSVSEQL